MNNMLLKYILTFIVDNRELVNNIIIVVITSYVILNGIVILISILRRKYLKYMDYFNITLLMLTIMDYIVFKNSNSLVTLFYIIIQYIVAKINAKMMLIISYRRKWFTCKLDIVSSLALYTDYYHHHIIRKDVFEKLIVEKCSSRE